MRLLKDEQAQASVEYMLMLAFSLAMVISVIKRFVQPILAKFADRIAAQMEASLFSKSSMHRLRIGK